MQFFTPINISHSEREISYQDRILSLGSCFADNISKKLKEAYFRINTNPFGVLYNPSSIAECLLILAKENSCIDNLPIVQHQGLYHSMLHHGSFSKANKEEFDKGISRSIELGRQWFKDASVLIITFGTAWVYEKDGVVVSNCHKLPEQQFFRYMLNVEQIVTLWGELLHNEALKNKHIIFTVSPIRHIKDGLHENQLSKATLLLAISQLQDRFTNISYFPSYELLIDELRDYRFYADDMLHPSVTAIDYIFERFAQTYFSKQTQQETIPLRQLHQQLEHRPLHKDSIEYEKFLAKTEQKLSDLSKRYPWIGG